MDRGPCCLQPAAPVGLSPLTLVLPLNPLPPQAAVPIGLSPPCALPLLPGLSLPPYTPFLSLGGGGAKGAPASLLYGGSTLWPQSPRSPRSNASLIRGDNKRRLKRNRRRLEGRTRRLEGNRRRLEGRTRRLEGNRRRLESRTRRLEGNRRRLESRTRRLEGNRRRLEGNRPKGPLDSPLGLAIRQSGHSATVAQG